jgi:hypothetical protein
MPEKKEMDEIYALESVEIRYFANEEELILLIMSIMMLLLL